MLGGTPDEEIALPADPDFDVSAEEGESAVLVAAHAPADAPVAFLSAALVLGGTSFGWWHVPVPPGVNMRRVPAPKAGSVQLSSLRPSRKFRAMAWVGQSRCGVIQHCVDARHEDCETLDLGTLCPEAEEVVVFSSPRWMIFDLQGSFGKPTLACFPLFPVLAATHTHCVIRGARQDASGLEGSVGRVWDLHP